METLTDKPIPFQLLYVGSSPERLRGVQNAVGNKAVLTHVHLGWEGLLHLDEDHAIDLILYEEAPDCRLFMEELNRRPYLKELPVLLLSPKPIGEFGAEPFRGRVIDVLPPEDFADRLQTRLTYLIRKKQYADSERAQRQGAAYSMPLGKRLFDIAGSFTALALLSPLLLLVAVLIRLDSKGPIFYKSKRVGTGYRIFDMYKFRTMRVDADKLLAGMASQNMYGSQPVEDNADGRCETCRLAGSECRNPLVLDNQIVCETLHLRNQQAKAMFSKFKEDPRVTRLGRFLRNASIDELPQFFNILKGDMSFVGNRPLPLYEAERLTTTAYARRFGAPAGLTGLWQVTKRGRAGVSDQERIQLDALYTQKFSFKTDLIILLKTFKAVFQKENV